MVTKSFRVFFYLHIKAIQGKRTQEIHVNNSKTENILLCNKKNVLYSL